MQGSVNHIISIIVMTTLHSPNPCLTVPSPLRIYSLRALVKKFIELTTLATPKMEVCAFGESLPIKRRADLELMQEMVAEVAFGLKKLFSATVYRSLSQNTEQFEHFIMNRHQRERSYSLIIIGRFNCRTSQR